MLWKKNYVSRKAVIDYVRHFTTSCSSWCCGSPSISSWLGRSPGSCSSFSRLKGNQPAWWLQTEKHLNHTVEIRCCRPCWTQIPSADALFLIKYLFFFPLHYVGYVNAFLHLTTMLVIVSFLCPFSLPSYFPSCSSALPCGITSISSALPPLHLFFLRSFLKYFFVFLSFLFL